MTNESFKKLSDYTLEEIGSFSLDQIGGIEFGRQFTPITNTTRVSSAETWATITTTWASETRTWIGCISKVSNSSFKNLGAYTFEEIGTFSLDQVGGVEFSRQFSPITNVAKP